MKILLLSLIAIVLTATATRAQPTRPTSFIPRGYRILAEGRATGDLNGDGRPDVVLALGAVAEDSPNVPADELPPRLLLVLWRTAAGGYTLAATARKALLGKGDGGIYGDPFAGLGIKNGVLTVNHYGGSSWRWNVTGRFRWQQGGICLIGTTYFYTHNIEEPCPKLAGDHRPGDVYRDENLLTGAFTSVKVSDDCRLLENKRGRQPVKPLQWLADYQPQP